MALWTGAAPTLRNKSEALRRSYSVKKHVDDSRGVLPRSRALCGTAKSGPNTLVPGAGDAFIAQNLDGKISIRVGHRCKSVWACPQCSAALQRQRSDLVSRSLSVWRSACPDSDVLMLTLTIPHYRRDVLADLIGQTHGLRLGLLGAFNRLQTSKTWRELRRSGFLRHSVRAIEVTTGRAGWHPHLHLLLYVDWSKLPGGSSPYVLISQGRGRSPASYAPLKQNPSRADLIVFLRGLISYLWRRVCTSAGLVAPHFVHGTHLTACTDEIAGYVAKWGAPSEISSSHAKTAAPGNYSISDLQGHVSMRGPVRSDRVIYARLAEYYRTMPGRRQLSFSRECPRPDSDWNPLLLDLVQISSDAWQRLAHFGGESMLRCLVDDSPLDHADLSRELVRAVHLLLGDPSAVVHVLDLPDDPRIQEHSSMASILAPRYNKPFSSRALLSHASNDEAISPILLYNDEPMSFSRSVPHGQ